MEALDEEDQRGYNSELSTDWWQLLCKDIIIQIILLALPPHAKAHFDRAFLKWISNHHKVIQFQRHFVETLFQGLVWIDAGR